MDKHDKSQEAVKRIAILTGNGLDSDVMDVFPNKIACFVRTKANASVMMPVEHASLVCGRDLPSELKGFENANSAVAYLTTLTQTDFGTIFDIFYVSDYEEEWEDDRNNLERGCACNYALNLEDDICSEFGWETFAINEGNLIRVG